jgi:hypothetical protein
VRRGIATFSLLARFAPATLAGALTMTAGLVLLVSRPTPPGVTPTVGTDSLIQWNSAVEIRGLVLAPQDFPGATLTDCRLVGELLHSRRRPPRLRLRRLHPLAS